MCVGGGTGRGLNGRFEKIAIDINGASLEFIFGREGIRMAGLQFSAGTVALDASVELILLPVDLAVIAVINSFFWTI